MIESGTIAGLTAPEDRYHAYARDAILAKDYIKALRLRGFVVREADRVLSRLDALVAPGRPADAAAARPGFRRPHRPSPTHGRHRQRAGLPAVGCPTDSPPTACPSACSSWAGPGRKTRCSPPPAPGRPSPTGISAGPARWLVAAGPLDGYPMRHDDTASEHFESLLSRRARIGWGVPVATPRPSMSAALRVRRRLSRPRLVPVRGHGRGHGRMMQAEGAGRHDVRRAAGLPGAARADLPQVRAVRGASRPTPENIIVANGSGQALALAFSAFIDPGRRR